MRRLFRFAAYTIAAIIGGFLGCAFGGDRIVGSGNAVTETRAVGEVTEVELNGTGELVLAQDEKPGLVVTADDNILPHLESVTEGGKLRLRTQSGWYTPKTPITYRLSVKTLSKVRLAGSTNLSSQAFRGDALTVELSGAGTATLRGLNLKSLTFSRSGAGSATLGGTTQALQLSISGAGDIQAQDLQANTAEATVSGAGNVTVWVTETLKARISGAGSIKYKGAPKVEQTVSGAGTIGPIAR